ncbi:MAG: hypothetical protein KGL39_01560 [Patescibacteria group bacterium]|nr:hypothetical protein [Patescibacteria group bacterium]
MEQKGVRAFKFLYADSRADRKASDVLERHYKQEHLVSRPVVRDEYNNNQYLVFPDRAALWEHCRALPESERCLHEVVFSWQPQRIKFDIDIKAAELDAFQIPPELQKNRERKTVATDADIDAVFGTTGGDAQPTTRAAPTKEEVARSKVDAIMNCVIDTILEELHVAYHAEPIAIDRDALIVTDSSGPTATGYKHSFHILTRLIAVPNNHEAKELTTRVLESLPVSVRPFVDPGVNCNTQSFRLGMCAKAGTRRFKTVTTRYGTAACDITDTMVVVLASSGVRVLPKVFVPCATERSPDLPLPEATVAAVAEAARAATAGHTLRGARGSLLIYQRDRPTFCQLCRKTHHNDNTLMLAVRPADGATAEAGTSCDHVIVEFCRHAPGKSREVATVACAPVLTAVAAQASRAAARAEEAHGRIAGHIRRLREGKVDPHRATLFESLPDPRRHVYAEERMRPYELVDTLVVKAQMGLGKTRALRQFIDEHFPADGIRPFVLRFVTFRQTFSSSLRRADQFPDFALYSDHQGDLDHVRFPRLIVQVESLHRLKLTAAPDPVDLVVLDEVESILAQFNSGLHRRFNAAFAMFKWLLGTAAHVVCMDANVGDRTHNTLERMRAGRPAVFHWNQFRRAASDRYFFTGHPGAWTERLHAAIRAGRNVVVATNSLAEAETTREMVEAEFPTKRVALYSSKTAPSEKARHFADVDTHWAGLDVLIYTPTVSAGISFEREHFDCLFGDFGSSSCDVETSRQMLARVRSLRSREHFILLRGSLMNLPTDPQEIRRLINNKRAGLFRGIDDALLEFEYTPAGDVRFYESDFFFLWLETVSVANASRNDFARRFIDQVADTGAQVDVLATDADAEALAGLVAARRETKAAQGSAHHARVAAAADLTPDQASEIQASLSEQTDVSPENRFALEKWRLCDAFSWHGRPLDADFVRLYSPARARRVFQRLTQITAAPTIDAAIDAMRELERTRYSYVMETRVAGAEHANEAPDVLLDRKLYASQAHVFATWLLKVCGFACITDPRHVSVAALAQRIRGCLRVLAGNAPAIAFEFDQKAPNLRKLRNEAEDARVVATALRFINPVVRAMYGLEIRRHAASDSYRLAWTTVGSLFVFRDDPEPDDTKPRPRPHVPSRLCKVDTSVDGFLEDEFVHIGGASLCA